ncbi:cell division protein [Arthrobacter sp. RIT-PI-e]|uniref:DivIVA domain-containing protein n=1 Tax=Arthrobacter sp. RIT-PI-e TaxID=1681197 RepID=UPI000676414A|nr:DivIVA domain-containing protein [Arthrobacter sp. RIT-PI-e]KNC17683.1 cell division protein [Arthrobacter sp. RIT-PI-e]
MALTPEDVVNKRFQPTRLREGYDQDEVDDFLDEIVVELRRLNSENEELRRKAGDTSSPAPTSTTVPAPVSASTEDLSDGTGTTAPADVPAVVEPAATEDAVETTAAPTTSAASSVSAPSPSAQSAAGALAMAQRLHDEDVNAGVEQRDRIISEAQLEATGMVDAAEEKSRRTLSDLEQQKTVLERQVEQLRGFERDYRLRLRAYIEGQLTDLDSHTPLTTGTDAS